MGWVGVQFPGKERYVTLEWPPRAFGKFMNIISVGWSKLRLIIHNIIIDWVWGGGGGAVRSSKDQSDFLSSAYCTTCYVV